MARKKKKGVRAWHVFTAVGVAGAIGAAVYYGKKAWEAKPIEAIPEPKSLPGEKVDFEAEAKFVLQDFVNKSVKQVQDLRGGA